MNIIKKYSLIIFPVFLFFLIYLKFLFEIFYLNAIPMHDTLWSYINFQYVFNYFDYYNLFPSWIDTNTGGYPMYGILNFSSSIIAFPIIFASKLLGVGSFFAYLIIMSFFTFIFFIGLFLFIRDNTKKYLIIFTIIFVSYILSTDFFFISQSHWWYTLIPLQIYFIVKFFKENKYKYLFYVINSQLIFSILYWTYYNLFSIYFLGIIIILFFLITNYLFKIKINFKNILNKNYLNFVVFIFLIIVNLLSFFYFRDNYFINTPFRFDNLALSNYGFIGNIPLAHKFKKILFGEYAQSFYSIGFTNLIFIFLFYILLNLRIFFKNYVFVTLFFSSIIIILISCGNEFFVTSAIISFLRIFPFLEIFKHYGYVIHFLIPFVLIISAISINHFFETYNKRSIFYSFFGAFLFKLLCILLFFNYFQDHYNEVNKKQIIVNLLFSYLVIYFILYLLVYKKNLKKIYFIIIPLLVISIFPNYLFSFKEYKNERNFLIFENFNLKNNIKYKKKCLMFEEAVEKSSYFKDILSLPGNKYNNINLNLEMEICDPFAKIAVDGSEKEYSKYFFSGQSIELKNTNINNSLFLKKLFDEIVIYEDSNLDGILNNEDKYLMISNKSKLSLWTVVFRIQFAETYLNQNVNKRLKIIFQKNKNNDWKVLVDNKLKDQPLYKIVNNMIINKKSLTNDNQKFVSIFKKEKNSYKFSTFSGGDYKLKLSFNQNWKLRDLNKDLLVSIKNKNGYLSFKTPNGSNYMLNYENKYEIFLFFCQLITIIYLILILYKKKFKIFL